MSEEAKKAIEELVKATEGNDVAKAFLNGFKNGLNARCSVKDDKAIYHEAEKSTFREV